MGAPATRCRTTLPCHVTRRARAARWRVPCAVASASACCTCTTPARAKTTCRSSCCLARPRARCSTLEKWSRCRALGRRRRPVPMMGRSPPFQALLELIARVGLAHASVLLLGESGTGKELAARAIHQASARAARPLVVVDCASLPETLFESELFGQGTRLHHWPHGACRLVEAAQGGTLFLDEVGDIPLTMQVKLLRLLESGTYRRGPDRAAPCRHPPDCRHPPRPARHGARGRFRQDLYYRLSTFPIMPAGTARACRTLPCWPSRCWRARGAGPAAGAGARGPAPPGCSTPSPATCAGCATCWRRAALLTDQRQHDHAADGGAGTGLRRAAGHIGGHARLRARWPPGAPRFAQYGRRIILRPPCGPWPAHARNRHAPRASARASLLP